MLDLRRKYQWQSDTWMQWSVPPVPMRDPLGWNRTELIILQNHDHLLIAVKGIWKTKHVLQTGPFLGDASNNAHRKDASSVKIQT